MGKLAEDLQEIYEQIASGLAKEIGDLFKSSEGKGSFNADRLREKIQHHLPSKYSFTHGTELFDRSGNRTNAKDIVIYDRTKNLFLPPIFDQTVLPVDTVYAVFEVKTTLTGGELSRAVKQIQEVKKLHYLKRTIVQPEMINERLSQTKRETSPPVGVIVGYTTDWKRRETIEKHLLEASAQIPEIERWDILYVIDRAFLAVTQLLSGSRLAKYISFVNFGSDFQKPDIGAMFLNFLLILETRLRARFLTIPVIDFRQDHNLAEWLLRMKARSFDESGNRIPREKA